MRYFLALLLAAAVYGAPAESRKLAWSADAARTEAPLPFRAIGVTWPGGAARALAVRASADGAVWSDWIAIHAEEAEGRAAGLAWFGDLRRYVELSGDTAGVEVLFIDPGVTAAKPEPRRQSAAPPIVTREQWGCTHQTCPAAAPPSFTTPTHLIVHHTAGANAAADWAAVVRSIWVLHVRGNGWNDIGYNYLIAPDGVVYEGRAGGDGVLGAHFSGVNTGTMGVSLIGTFSSTAVPAPAVSALVALLTWQSDKWRLDPAGQSVHSASGLVLNHISGHRDAGLSPRASGTTECPGNALFALLPRVRADVRQRLDADCPARLSWTARCVPPEAGAIEVEVDSTCPWTPESRAPWITVDASGNRARLAFAANPGERRTGTVSIGGRTVALTQARAGGWPIACIAPLGVVAAAGADDRPVTPNSLVSVFGENLAPTEAHASAQPLPDTLGGVQLQVNGRNVPLLYAGPQQINAHLPSNVNPGTARAQVIVNGVAGPETNFWVTEAVPVLFATPEGRAIGYRQGAALVVYLVGAGRAGLPWSVTIGGRPAEPLFLGAAPGFPGVQQLNVGIPGGLPPGDHELVLTVSGAPSRPVLVSVEAP